MIDISTHKSSIFDVWCQHAEIDLTSVLDIITYKKVRRYALEWKRVWWSPNFYELVDVPDSIKTIINPQPKDLCPVSGTQKNLSIDQVARVGFDQTLRVPMQPDTYRITPIANEITKRVLEVAEYKFPVVRMTRALSIYEMEMLSDRGFISALTDHFIRQARPIIEKETTITLLKDVAIDKLPPFRITREMNTAY